MPRRRSLSATRTVTSTVNFVGRIGASLRISSKNAIKRFDSAETSSSSTPSNPATSITSSWRARLDRSKSAVCQRSLPSNSFDTDTILLAAGTAIEAGIGSGSEDNNCTAGELVEYQPNSHALISTQRSFYSTSAIKSAPSSCPSTPQMIRRRYMKEGATQLTSLSTLITHHRYLFLFNDLLLISKQKGANSYKLKQKINLERLWISSNNCTHSFLIGWPLNNYVAHFNCEDEKNEWYEKLSECVRRRFKEKSTTVSVAIKIEGRQQNIKKEIHNGQTASDLLLDLIRGLDLTPTDPLAYELNFETNYSSSGGSGIGSGSSQQQQLHGIENIYAILMEHILSTGVQLSETQMAHLDTCPLVHCRLVLKAATSSRPSTAMTLMSQVLKVLSRSENKRLFGKELEGSMPPQPVLTMIDHLMIHGCEVEGIMRKSPKQATVRLLKTQLDNGQVPDFHQFNAHVTASLLKEYLRSIPGQLLLSGNYHLWIEVGEEFNEARKMHLCKNLLKLLPQCHTVLLKSILKLLRKIAANEYISKMNINSLGVCIAPSLLENPNIVDSARRVPDLAIYLIKNAPELFDKFEDDGPAIFSDSSNSQTQVLRLHQSTDSGLSTDEPSGDLMARSSISPDSALFDSPISESSMDDEHHHGPRIEEIETIQSPESSKERTPVLSRENSDVYTFPHRYQWRSHLSADAANASRLTRQEAFRQVVSTQSSISSQDNEELPPSLNEEIRVVRLGPSETSIPNVDDLRVSDIIISHRKKESTDSTKTLIGRTDSNGYSCSTSSKSSSDYSGKFSNVSSLEGRMSLSSIGGSPYVSSLSSSSSSNGSSYNYPSKNASSVTKTVPVILQSPKSNIKRQLLTKSDTLGLTSSPVSSPKATSNSTTTTTTTSTILTPLHRTQRLPASNANHGSLDRSQPSSKVLSRVPLTREAAIYSQNSLDRKSAATPYRPPKKTAAEIVLDQNLEVNWSVPSIRSIFQTKDSKPAKIDTVYATLESLKKQQPFEAAKTTTFSR